MCSLALCIFFPEIAAVEGGYSRLGNEGFPIFLQGMVLTTMSAPSKKLHWVNWSFTLWLTTVLETFLSWLRHRQKGLNTPFPQSWSQSWSASPPPTDALQVQKGTQAEPTIHLQHIPVHFYAEVSPTVLNGAFFLGSVYRIAALL